MQFTDLGPDIPIALALKTEWYPQCYTYATWSLWIRKESLPYNNDPVAIGWAAGTEEGIASCT